MKTVFRPLYQQVYETLTQRLKDGVWRPNDVLPSEFALADELGVSQGTVRKALNAMVAEQLLIRHQGKGTFVAGHTQASSLYRFFRWRKSQGESLVPTTEVIAKKRRRATREEDAIFNIASGESVCELVRLRSLLGQATLLEFVVQPLSVFPDIDTLESLPNSLYTLYQDRYGVSIIQAKDELSAVPMPEKYAHYLDLQAESPVLCVSRQSINIDGRVVEWSRAYGSTQQFVYAVNLR